MANSSNRNNCQNDSCSQGMQTMFFLTRTVILIWKSVNENNNLKHWLVMVHH